MRSGHARVQNHCQVVHVNWRGRVNHAPLARYVRRPSVRSLTDWLCYFLLEPTWPSSNMLSPDQATCRFGHNLGALAPIDRLVQDTRRVIIMAALCH